MMPKTVFIVSLLLCLSFCKCNQNKEASQLVETKAKDHVPSRSTVYISTGQYHPEVRGSPSNVAQSTGYTSRASNNPGYIYVARNTAHTSQSTIVPEIQEPVEGHEVPERHEASESGGNYGCGGIHGGHESYGSIGLGKPSLLHGLVGFGTKVSDSLGKTTNGIVIGIEALKKLAEAGIQIKTGLTKAIASIPLKALDVVTTGAAVKVNAVKKAVAGVSHAVASGKAVGYGGYKGYGGYGHGSEIYVTQHGKDGTYRGSDYGSEGTYGAGKDVGSGYGGKELGGGYGRGAGYGSHSAPYGQSVSQGATGNKNTYVSTHGGTYGNKQGGHNGGYV